MRERELAQRALGVLGGDLEGVVVVVVLGELCWFAVFL